MTYQQQIDTVNYQGLGPISLSSQTGTVIVTARFGTPLGDWVGPAFTLTPNTSASALNYLWQQASGGSLPTFPSNAEICTLSTTGLVYVGFNARRDGTIDPVGTPTRVLFTGDVRLGPAPVYPFYSTINDPTYKAEDAAHVSGDKGLMMLAVRQDSIGSLASANGEYVPLGTDSDGILRASLPGSNWTTGEQRVNQSYLPLTLTTTGSVKAAPGRLHSHTFAATTAAVIQVYNNTAPSGTLVSELHVPAGDTRAGIEDIECTIGIYVQYVSGTGTFSASYR